jgi:hypothetical protein
MTEIRQAPTTLMVGDTVVHVRVDGSRAPRSVIVNVEVDYYERSRSFEEPRWHPPPESGGDMESLRPLR